MPGGQSFAEKVVVAGSPVDSAKLSRPSELGRGLVTFVDLNHVSEKILMKRSTYNVSSMFSAMVSRTSSLEFALDLIIPTSK